MAAGVFRCPKPVPTTHRPPWGRRRAGWIAPNQSCGWAGWCRSVPLMFPGCSAGLAPSCCPSPPASWGLWPTMARCAPVPTLGRRRTWRNSVRQGLWGRPAPSSPWLPLGEEMGRGRETEQQHDKKSQFWINIINKPWLDMPVNSVTNQNWFSHITEVLKKYTYLVSLTFLPGYNQKF